MSEFCSKCGSAVPDNARFCVTCGTQVESQDQMLVSAVASASEAAVPDAAAAASSETTASPETNAASKAPSSIEAALQPVSAVVYGAEAVPAVSEMQKPEDVPGAATRGTFAPITTVSQEISANLPPRTPKQIPVQPPQRQWNTPPSSFTPPNEPEDKKHGREDQPPKGRFAMMSTAQFIGAILLMSIPVIGFIFMVTWAAGGTRKLVKRNLARAYLILIAAVIVIVLLLFLLFLIFAFPAFTEWVNDVIRQLQLEGFIQPGVTVDWGLFGFFIR